MFIDTPEKGYHLSKSLIKTVEKAYKAKYMGYWCTKNPKGGWNEQPIDVFYVRNPDKSKGHSNYFGMFFNEKKGLMITNAVSAFEQPITGILCDDGEVIVSRYRHDCVMKGDYMIDGGRDYLRCSPGRLVRVDVFDGEFIFMELPDFNYTQQLSASPEIN